jgi:hypothetical protein
MGNIFEELFFVYLTKLFNEAGKCDIGFYGSEFFMIAQCFSFFVKNLARVLHFL